MADEFILRAMRAGDGAAINRLNEEAPDSGAVAFYTEFLHDPYEVLMRVHSGTIGVVAEAPGGVGLAGMGLVRLSKGVVEGEVRPMAYLSNLKVHPRFRRQGLAKQLAQWRIEMAREQMGEEGIIFANIQAGNVGSLKAARRWANVVLENRVLGVVVTTTNKPPRPVARVEVRPAQTGEAEAIAHELNTFYQEYNLYLPASASDLLFWQEARVNGRALHRYFVAVDSQGQVLAGLGVTVEGLLLQMHVRRLPVPLRIANGLLKLMPPDGTMRRLHVEKFWFAPGQERVGRYLWEAVRWQTCADGTHLMVFFDTLSPFGRVIETPKFVPQPKGMVVFHAPVPLNPNRPIVQHI